MQEVENGSKLTLVTSMSAKVEVTVLSIENCEIAGYFYSPFFDRYSKFSSAMEFLVQMNSLFDDLQFPQSSVEYRTFKSKRGRNGSRERDESTMSETIQNENAQAKFVVHVQFRQNATWQGTIEWVDGNKTQCFRSALEMLKLMEDALTDGKDMKMNTFLD